MLSYKNSQIGTPSAMNDESKSVEKSILVRIEKLILFFRADVSVNLPSSILLDCSLIEGIIVTANELINVVGIIIKGKVIPIIMPNSESASVEE